MSAIMVPASTRPARWYPMEKKDGDNRGIQRPFTSFNIPTSRAPHSPQDSKLPALPHSTEITSMTEQRKPKKARAKDRDGDPHRGPSRRILRKAGISYLPQTANLKSTLWRLGITQTRPAFRHLFSRYSILALREPNTKQGYGIWLIMGAPNEPTYFDSTRFPAQSTG